MDGLLAGAARRIGVQALGPQLGPAIGLYAVGHMRGNETLETLAGMAGGDALLAGGLNLGNLLGGLTPPAAGGGFL